MVEIYERFGGNCCLRLRGGIWREQDSSKRRKMYTRSNAVKSNNSVALQAIASNFIPILPIEQSLIELFEISLSKFLVSKQNNSLFRFNLL